MSNSDMLILLLISAVTLQMKVDDTAIDTQRVTAETSSNNGHKCLVIVHRLLGFRLAVNISYATNCDNHNKLNSTLRKCSLHTYDSNCQLLLL